MGVALKEHYVQTGEIKSHLQKRHDVLISQVDRKIHELQKKREKLIAASKKDSNLAEPLGLGELRNALRWTRNQLAQVMNASDRAIFNWEAGDPISPVYAAKLRELQNIFSELSQIMKPEQIGPWLLTEMEEFEGRTPADLISKGETGRVWESLFYLRSGMPD